MMRKRIVVAAGLLFVVAFGSAMHGASAIAQTADTTSTSLPPTTTTKPKPKTVKVTASSFKFKPNTITVARRQKVTISLHSTDQLHDFVIRGKGTIAEAKSGQTKKGSFTLRKPGKYTFYCSIDSHRAAGMEGTITVN